MRRSTGWFIKIRISQVSCAF